MKYPPPTVGKFRTVTKLTVRKFRTLLLVNQGRVVWGWSWAGLVLSGWLEAIATNATRRSGIRQHSVVTFEKSGGLHAHDAIPLLLEDAIDRFLAEHTRARQALSWDNT